MSKYRTCTEYWLDPERLAFRGEFEAMYREIEDPWGCLKGAGSENNTLFAALLAESGPFRSVLDIGCGLGGFTLLLAECFPGCRMTGLDVSASAVAKAGKLFPEARFETRNVLTDPLDDLGRFDAVVLSEVLWYLLEDLDGVFAKVLAALEPGGTVGFHQYFPADQRFGKDVIDGVAGFESYLDRLGRLKAKNKTLRPASDGRVLLATYTKEG